MNITLALQELDDLIVRHTQPPVTAILRNKLHPLRDQIEAYIGKEQERVQLAAQVKAQQDAIKLPQTTPTPHTSAPAFEHRRGLYFQPSDPIPFCPRCKESSGKNIHLFGPVEMMDKSVQRWECHTCHYNYTASGEENFRPKADHYRNKGR